jgi:hypothetical protein
MGIYLRRLIAAPIAGLLLLWPATAASASHDPRYFYGAGSSPDEAAAGARASMAAYERQQGVDCVERSVSTGWNWEREFWEANLTADCPPDNLVGAGVHRLDDRNVPGWRLLRRSHPPCDARLGQPDVGFTQEQFDDLQSADPQGVDPHVRAAMLREMAGKYPYITEIAMAAAHDDESVVGQGCDDQFEFEFALDLLLDGLEGLPAARVDVHQPIPTRRRHVTGVGYASTPAGWVTGRWENRIAPSSIGPCRSFSRSCG